MTAWRPNPCQDYSDYLSIKFNVNAPLTCVPLSGFDKDALRADLSNGIHDILFAHVEVNGLCINQSRSYTEYNDPSTDNLIRRPTDG